MPNSQRLQKECIMNVKQDQSLLWASFFLPIILSSIKISFLFDFMMHIIHHMYVNGFSSWYNKELN